MKKNLQSFSKVVLILLFTFHFQLFTFHSFAQSPQSFQYQAVVRDAGGNPLQSHAVNFRLSIILGPLPGTIQYIETHAVTTNTFGIATLAVGSGTPITNLFSDIDWSVSPHFLKVEADPGGGYVNMGTTQLLSVPYALYAEQAGNAQTYSAGTGITLTGTTFNAQTTSPLWNANQLQNTSVSSTTPTTNQVLKYDGTSWVPTIDLNTGTPGGLDKTVQFNNSGSFGGDTAMIWDNTNKRLGVGTTSPNGRMIIRGSATALPSEPLFEVKNAAGQTVFVVYQDSVSVYVNDASSNQGGFAVSGRNSSKAFTHNYLKVTPNNTRIHTGDSLSGFGVTDINGGPTASYMQMTPKNYFIGHEAGKSITSGRYNSFIGYQSGYSDTSGYKNYFIGYRSGYNNLSGYGNIFIGDSTCFTNTTGYKNVIIGNQSGVSNLTGNSNVFIGNNAGYLNTGGNYNVFLGYRAGYSNITGVSNVILGYYSGYTNNASYNVFQGYFAGYSNTTGPFNVANGYEALYYNTTGYFNTANGSHALLCNKTGYNNTALGKNAGYGASGIDFIQCNFVGAYSYPTVARTNVTMLGYGIANAQCTGDNQVLLGNTAVTQIRAQVTGITAYSDARFKTDIKDNVAGLDFILKLKPVTYNIRPKELHKIWGTPDSLANKIDHSEIEKMRFIGFIAQDVEKAAKECGFNFPGIDVPRNDKEVYSLRYSDFIMPIVKAVQELNEKNNSLEKEIETLKTENTQLKLKSQQIDKLQSENQSMKSDIEKIKMQLNASAMK